MVSFLDVTGIKPCPDLSPNQNALRIASGTEPTLIRKEDTTPLRVVQFLCSLHHCKRWRRWSTFNGRQRSGRRANRPPCEGVWPYCLLRAATANHSNSCTCGLERFLSVRNDTFVDSELCSYTGDDRIKMGRTILLERRQTKSVCRRDDCPAYCDLIGRGQSLRRKWRGIGLGRSENKRPETRRS
ncbi:hypothetical protein TNCV_4524841 [Trichonephila clavipes]|nr:hypothetical protein TNCV_4524841 [Trichonephila clavipes]